MKPESEVGIYSHKKDKLDRENSKLEASKLSKKNKKLIRNFQDNLSAKGSGQERISKLTYQLRKLLEFLKKDLDKLTKIDIEKAISNVNKNETYSEATKADYRRALKQFFRYFRYEDVRFDSDDKIIRKTADKLYYFIENLSSTYKYNSIDPSTILTDDDIEKVIRHCNNIRDKAFIKFLHETGLRAGEILGLKRKHIVIKKNIGEAYVDGKTGKRTVQFTKSMSYIVRWLDEHPSKDNETFVWLNISNHKKHTRLRYRFASEFVKKCFKKAGVTKKHNLHWFRHSRATLNAPHWTETIMCKYFGWVIGSRQVRTYCHISPKQIEDAFLKMNGLSEEQEEKKSLPQLCGCGTTNDSFSRYCYRCGNPLTIQTAVQDQEIVKTETGLAIKEMMEMFKDPEMMKTFMEFRACTNNTPKQQ